MRLPLLEALISRGTCQFFPGLVARLSRPVSSLSASAPDFTSALSVQKVRVAVPDPSHLVSPPAARQPVDLFALRHSPIAATTGPELASLAIAPGPCASLRSGCGRGLGAVSELHPPLLRDHTSIPFTTTTGSALTTVIPRALPPALRCSSGPPTPSPSLFHSFRPHRGKPAADPWILLPVATSRRVHASPFPPRPQLSTQPLYHHGRLECREHSAEDSNCEARRGSPQGPDKAEEGRVGRHDLYVPTAHPIPLPPMASPKTDLLIDLQCAMSPDRGLSSCRG